MKNTRSYKLPALLLAVVMILAALSAAAADGSYVGPIGNYTYKPQDAAFAFASDGITVGSAADLDPNKASTMTVSVPANEGMPKNTTGQIVVAVPDDVIIAAADAEACTSDSVSCKYRVFEGQRQLVFRWKTAPQSASGFSATLIITPNAPATREDVSGTKILTVRDKNKALKAVTATLKNIDSTNRLTAVTVSEYGDSVIASGTELPAWKIQRVTGDWYSISCNGLYLRFGDNGNNISLTETPYYFQYKTEGAGNQFVATGSDGTKYYLNNKSNDVSKGIQASTYNDQSVELHTRFRVPANQGLVTFSTNGGSPANTFDPILAEAGTVITLPDYTGKKNNKQFVGWAAVSNIYEIPAGKTSSYTEVYLPGTEYTIREGQAALYAVFNEKGTDVRFGFRIDGSIPDEPGNYQVSGYTGHMTIKDTLKLGRWVVDVDGSKAVEGNHIANAVTDNLRILPSDEQIQEALQGTKLTYDPETMYVHWYVLKYAGQWKVDGVIRTRTANSIAYSANINAELKESIIDMPLGYELGENRTVIVGSESSGRVRTPSLDGYVFNGWNSEPDGSGTAYQSGEETAVEGKVIFYAQWTRIETYKVAYTIGNERVEEETEEPEYRAGETVTLRTPERKNNYLFSGWKMDGETIEGDTFVMPEDDVEITGEYYGPIYVDIRADWPEGQTADYGTMITLTAVLKNAEGLDCTLLWQYQDGDNWVDVPDSDTDTIVYELTDETSGRIWRVAVIDAQPHRE